MMMYRIADVCGTLVRDDTTIGLLEWHFSRRHRWRYWVVVLLTARLSPFRILFLVAEKVSGAHLLKHQLIRLLRGDSVQELQESADQYVEWLLANRRVGVVWDLLQGDSESGSLVLASASLDPVVSALARRMDADHVASSLAAEDGVLLGRYEHDLTGEKVEALDRHLTAAWRSKPYMAISDNLTDRTLLQGAAQAYVVLHGEGRRHRWGGTQAEYITI